MSSDLHQALTDSLIHEEGARPGTVQIVRDKRNGDRAVVATNFDRRPDRPVRGFIGMRALEDSGWQSAGGSWLSGRRDVAGDSIWLSTGGWSSPEGGVWGGWINDSSCAIQTIRLTDPAGRIEEDAVDAGVVIFMWSGDFDAHGAAAEFLDDRGRVLRTEPSRRDR